MTFENKGAGRDGNTYLICDSARRRLGCEARRWRYVDFESSFLAFVRELDLESVLDADGNAEKEANFNAEIEALRGEIASVAELMEKTFTVGQRWPGGLCHREAHDSFAA
jgi:hypothetical protein